MPIICHLWHKNALPTDKSRNGFSLGIILKVFVMENL
jgi:hypothetical protein